MSQTQVKLFLFHNDKKKFFLLALHFLTIQPPNLQKKCLLQIQQFVTCFQGLI